jgi:uncharacterized peroxidase-related enzyme
MTTTFRQHSIDAAPAEARSALQAIERGLGFVPNLFATLAESPITLEGYQALDAVLMKGSFTAKERQLILTAVSSANGCVYCTAAHSTLADGLRAAADAIAAARGEGMASDPRLDALVHFTHVVVRDRGHIASAELNAFLASGFTPAHALEVVAHVGLKTISNYIAGFAKVPLDKAFQDHRWQRASAAA